MALRSGLKAQVHPVLAKEGVAVPMSDLFGVAGRGPTPDALPRRPRRWVRPVEIRIGVDVCFCV